VYVLRAVPIWVTLPSSSSDNDLVPANGHQLTIKALQSLSWLCSGSIWPHSIHRPDQGHIYVNSEGYVVLTTLPARGSEPYNPPILNVARGVFMGLDQEAS